MIYVCEQADSEAALHLVLEAQIREEVSAEFMELFSNMEKDYRSLINSDTAYLISYLFICWLTYLVHIMSKI